MSTFLLDPNYADFVFTAGRMSLITSGPETAQKLNAKFAFFKGGWFLDQSLGMPWFQALLIKNPSVPIITSIIRAIILTTPGVKSIISLPVSYNPTAREILWGPVQIQHDSGAVIVGGRGAPFIVNTKGLVTQVAS